MRTDDVIPGRTDGAMRKVNRLALLNGNGSAGLKVLLNQPGMNRQTRFVGGATDKIEHGVKGTQRLSNRPKITCRFLQQ